MKTKINDFNFKKYPFVFYEGENEKAKVQRNIEVKQESVETKKFTKEQLQEIARQETKRATENIKLILLQLLPYSEVQLRKQAENLTFAQLKAYLHDTNEKAVKTDGKRDFMVGKMFEIIEGQPNGTKFVAQMSEYIGKVNALTEIVDGKLTLEEASAQLKAVLEDFMTAYRGPEGDPLGALRGDLNLASHNFEVQNAPVKSKQAKNPAKEPGAPEIVQPDKRNPAEKVIAKMFAVDLAAGSNLKGQTLDAFNITPADIEALKAFAIMNQKGTDLTIDLSKYEYVLPNAAPIDDKIVVHVQPSVLNGQITGIDFIWNFNIEGGRKFFNNVSIPFWGNRTASVDGHYEDKSVKSV